MKAGPGLSGESGVVGVEDLASSHFAEINYRDEVVNFFFFPACKVFLVARGDCFSDGSDGLSFAAWQSGQSVSDNI